MNDYNPRHIQWHCDGCSFPIGVGEGHVRVINEDVWNTQREVADWNDSHPVGMSLGLVDIESHPKPVHWKSLHYICDEKTRASYSIGVERIQTSEAALAWTAHLMGKTWLNVTDWDRLIARLAEECGGDLI